MTVWTVVCQAPLSMGFSGSENWSELPFPSPGDPMVKNPLYNAGDMIPGWGTKSPHALEQLRLCATTREPPCHNYSIHATTRESGPETSAQERSLVLQLRSGVAKKRKHFVHVTSHGCLPEGTPKIVT